VLSISATPTEHRRYAAFTTANGAPCSVMASAVPPVSPVSFVMIVDPVSRRRDVSTTSARSVAAGGNGIAYVTAADLDDDNITDYVYAGDLQGNIWRFDLTNANPALWAASASPLFTTPGGQPITHPGDRRVGACEYRPATHHDRFWYRPGGDAVDQHQCRDPMRAARRRSSGIWDWNMGDIRTGWNSKGPCNMQVCPLCRPSLRSGPGAICSRSSSRRRTSIYRSREQHCRVL